MRAEGLRKAGGSAERRARNDAHSPALPLYQCASVAMETTTRSRSVRRLGTARLGEARWAVAKAASAGARAQLSLGRHSGLLEADPRHCVPFLTSPAIHPAHICSHSINVHLHCVEPRGHRSYCSLKLRCLEGKRACNYRVFKRLLLKEDLRCPG